MTGIFKQGMVAVVGVPFDGHSSFLPGAAAAPGEIREALRSPAANMCAENGVDLAAHPDWQDVGDLALGESGAVSRQIEKGVARLLGQGVRVVALGGDHSITFPIVKAHARKCVGMTILQLDAHPDLYDEYEGHRESHACPFARIMESRLARRLVQVGIRTMNPHQSAQAARFGVEIVGPSDFKGIEELRLEPPLYLSIDMDVFDPAFAPGVSHPEPGGFSTREVLGILQRLPCPLVGADIVEYNPRRDPHRTTARLAAKLLKEVLANLLGGASV
jgi:agmatinase